MPIKTNGYYNDPAFAQAASNLMQLFAPPSGSDAAGWATANAKNAEASRLAAQFDYLTNPANQSAPDFRQQADAYLLGTGSMTPNQSFYSVDLGDQTTRRGQDVTAATSRANNAADNQRSLLGTLYGPLNEGQIRPELPADIAGAYGLPAVALPSVAGAPKPMSESEVQGAERMRLAEQGLLTDQMILDTIIGAETPVEVVDPVTNQPRFSTPGAAVRTGAQPYEKGRNAAPSAVDRQDDIVIEDIDRALDSLGLTTTGLAAQVSGSIAGTPAHNLDALLDTVRANVGFDQLQKMREASPTGGALGNVTEKENALLQSVLGNLSTTQSEPQLRANLERLREVYLDIVHGPGNRPGGEAAVVTPDPGAPGASPYPDGTVIENDQGDRMVRRNGQWEPL